MVEMTVAQGLKKLKLIQKKIENELRLGSFVGVKKVEGKEEIKTKNSEETFVKNAKASKQKIEALIDNYYKISGAIAVSNATTTVSIGDKTYRVVEAIKRKENIDTEEKFLATLMKARASAINTVDNENAKVDKKVEDALKADTDKSSKEKILEFYGKDKLQLLDPLGSESLIKKMTEDIDTFKSEVDDALSTSNILTSINVDLDEE